MQQWAFGAWSRTGRDFFFVRKRKTGFFFPLRPREMNSTPPFFFIRDRAEGKVLPFLSFGTEERTVPSVPASHREVFAPLLPFFV